MKKIMKVAALTACVGAMLSFAGCGGGSPESVALKFAEKLYAEEPDFDGAGKVCTKETAALLTMISGMAKESEEFQANRGAKFEVAECKIDGNSATVTLKCTQKTGKVEMMSGKDAITLVKQDGEWKVNIKKD